EAGTGRPEDAEPRKPAARSAPPEVAVTDALRQGAAGDALAGRFGHPAVGHDRPGASWAARLAAFEDELAEPRIVADRHGDTAAAEFVARRVEHPDRVALHAEGLPDLLRGVVGERLAGRLRHHHADEMGLAGVVVEGRARLVRARQAAHVAHDGIDAGLVVGRPGARDVGVGIAVVLVPLHARAHGKHLAEV